jgi:hypothetical protein
MSRGWQRALAWLMAPWLMAQTSPPAQTAILQIRVVEGEGAIHATNSRAARGLSVEVTDETGKPVGSAAVSFRLPEEGPSGVFANGGKTEIVIAGPDGRATVWGMQWNRQEGPFQIRITAAKGQARAGTTVSQYLSQAAAPKPSGSVAILPGSKQPGRSSHKWLLITVLAVGAAAGAGLMAGMSHSSSSTAAAAASTTQTITIGSPVVTIGKP